MQAKQTAGRRLLVVDDEHIERMLVARAVTSLGFSVDGAANLDEAALLLGEHAYDAIVLDLALGETEGISLLPDLRAGGADPIVIFVSGMDDRVRAASARLAGTLGLRVAGALAKPVAPSALRDLLRTTPARAAPPALEETIQPSEAELALALARGEIAASFQPKVALRTGAVTSVEALARWHRTDGSILLPDLFIPLAEASGLIVPLTATILQQSFAACRRWQLRHPACGVAVNLSPLALANPALPDQIEDMLRRAELPPPALIAEITESMIIADPVLAAEVRDPSAHQGDRPGDRRFRHRARVAAVADAAAVHRVEDRQVLHRRLRDGHGGMEDHPRHHLAGARTWHVGGGRGDRNGIHRAEVARGRVRYRPGLAFRPGHDGDGVGGLAGAARGGCDVRQAVAKTATL